MFHCYLQIGSVFSDAENTSEEEYFKHSLPPPPCFFFIDRKDWTKLRKTQHLHRFKTLNWTTVIAKGIRTIHPLCSFGFKRHRVKSIGCRRSGPVFSCLGYCLFDDCPVEVEIKVQDESSLKALVEFRGSFVYHRWDQIKRRPVRGQERDVLSDTLSTKLPRSVFLDSMERLDDTFVVS